MLRFFRELFRDPKPTPPLIVRARGRGSIPTEVAVEAVWHPSGVKRAYRARHAQGMCLLPWMEDADRVSLHVRADGAEATIDVNRQDISDGRAVDLAM
jgi:hypothetical protein